MNYKMMGRFNALFLAVEALFMIPALIVSFSFGELEAAKAFLISIGIIMFVSGILAIVSKNAKKDFYAKEGLVCVGTSWIAMSVLGCLPFVLSGAIPNYIDALFEMVSGFTTTGASIIKDLEPIPKGVIYWRSFSHWLGGMGVLVFLLAIVPIGGQSEGYTMHLLRAESPGPDVGKLVPKMRQTAIVLYVSYIILSLINLGFLLLGKMNFFEAVCTMFGTAGTGGFGIKNDSMASYSPYIQNVTTIFMLLFGVNFSCYYLLILKQFKNVFKDEELRLYVCIVVSSIALISFNIYSLFGNAFDSLRHSAFQVASIITTTGYSTVDFNEWHSFSKTVLMILMVFGACAGSTGGGLKCARALLLMKNLIRNVSQILRPQKVKVIKVNGKAVDEKILVNTNAYFFVYIIIIVLSTLLLSLDGFSMMTNFSASLACFNNIGPGFEAVGPASNFSEYSIFSKIILIFDMLAGRLEIFPVLVLFSPKAWRR
ncbi:MAG: TrkH family potassium uptake protein [Clostridia bacterium]|nr:TrkH family potassium uptake protein [Clostridia bacterium]